VTAEPDYKGQFTDLMEAYASPIRRLCAAYADNAADREDLSQDIRIGALVALAFLLPMMLWAAAHGVTPLVRGAYALMAVGGGAIVIAEWIYLQWSRQALPGPVDARSQIQKTAFMLGRQVMLMNTAATWSSPVFVGVTIIGVWLYRERTHAEAFALWTITVAGWLAMELGTVAARVRLNDRRQQMERLLSELQEVAEDTMSARSPALSR
jgi:hypothetical protein